MFDRNGLKWVCVTATLAILFAVACGGGDGSSAESASETGDATAETPKPATSPPPAPQAISEEALIAALERGGLAVERLEEHALQPDQLAALPEEHGVIFTARVDDGHGNRTPMTFVELKGGEAQMVTGLNGIPLRNWFVVGTIDNHMKNHLVGAVR